MQGKLSDPILGGEGTLCKSGKSTWIVFEKQFAPTKNKIGIYVDESGGAASKSQSKLFEEFEQWYLKGIASVFVAVFPVFRLSTESELGKKLTSAEQMGNHFRLEAIDMNFLISRK